MTDGNDERIKCYGTRVECPRRCDCELGTPCLSRAREFLDDYHYQKQHVSVPQMEYDPGEDRDREDEEIAKAYYEAVADDSAPTPLQLDGITISPESLPVVLKVLERIADFYFHTPHVLDALLNTVVRGKSQSDIAREKHITRQCENKRLLRELGIAQKRNDIQVRRDRELEEKKRELSDHVAELHRREKFLSDLPLLHWRIFLLRFRDRRSARETAELAGCDIRTVFRVSHDLRRNLGEDVIPHVSVRKKRGKKRRGCT